MHDFISAGPGVFVEMPDAGGIYVEELPSFEDGPSRESGLSRESFTAGGGSGRPCPLYGGPGFRPVTSSRRGREAVDQIGWDERPMHYNPNAAEEYAHLAYPEHQGPAPTRASLRARASTRRAKAPPAPAPAPAPTMTQEFAHLLGPDPLRTFILILILVVLAFIMGGQYATRNALQPVLLMGNPVYAQKS